MHTRLTVKTAAVACLFCLLALSGVSLWAAPDVPRFINYQGELVDASGAPVATGNYRLTFSLWSEPLAGTKLWEQVQASVAVVEGRFNVILGPATAGDADLLPILDTDDSVYLQIQVASGTPISPRQQLLSAPFAGKARYATTAKDGVPVGTVMPFAGSSEPPRWLFCNGRSLATAQYPELFSAIGYAYGGSGTAFNVPDLRGRVIAGQDDMGGPSDNRLTGQNGGINGDDLGANGGSEAHTLVEDQMPRHTHSVTVTQRVHGDDAAGGSRVLTADRNIAYETVTISGMQADPRGGGQAHNNVQPTIILNYAIYTGR